MDVGLFGGTFDPIHLGHLRIAEEAREALRLARVLFIPAKLPPHKEGADLSPPEFRLEMVRRAVAGNPHFEASDLELRREGPSYSVLTLRQLRGDLAPRDRLWFLMGSDSYREVHTWHRYEELFELADVAVLSRPPDGRDLGAPEGLAASLTAGPQGFRHTSGREVRFVEVTLLDISSTEIRRAMAEGRSVRYLVPDSVREGYEGLGNRQPVRSAGSAP